MSSILVAVRNPFKKKKEKRSRRNRSHSNGNNNASSANFTMSMPSTLATSTNNNESASLVDPIPNADSSFIHNPPVPAAAARHRTSSFDISLLPSDSIRKRELHNFSVHYHVPTSKWLATIVRSVGGNGRLVAARSLSLARFSFQKETEARHFAIAYSPPKMMMHGLNCVCCSAVFARHTTTSNTNHHSQNHTRTGKQAYHCTNCGGQICNACSRRWGVRMVPKTYLPVNNVRPSTVRVCKSCHWLSNAFCLALLQGNYNNAVMIMHASGNINLRCSFADISKEAMFPIHCAVMGGNLDLVKWLVDGNGVPIMMPRPGTSTSTSSSGTGRLESVQTSKGRTLMDIVMTTGRSTNKKPKVAILAYFVQQGMHVTDTTDPTLAATLLQSVVSGGYHIQPRRNSRNINTNRTCPFISGGNSNTNNYSNTSFDYDSSNRSLRTIDDACIICCEKTMNCVLSPCGHQLCCSDCGNHLTHCPICKRSCNVLRIFKS